MSELLRRVSDGLAAHYSVDREIGRGGMATVFAARDLRHSREVAIKVLHPELARAVGPERFLREINTVARLDHPHILPLHDSGEVGGLLFYVMPLVRGESLRDLLNRERALPTERALRIAREVADGLQFAHAAGIVHRDVKPSNIMLSTGHARLADFGVAGTLDPDDEQRLTASGLIVGSPAYMSPEQAGGEPLGRRTDIYSLGCVLYEMLAGEPPFTGHNARQLYARRLSQKPASLTLLRDTVPKALDMVVARCLAVDPADRYESASDLQEALSVQALVGTRTETHASLHGSPRAGRDATNGRPLMVRTGDYLFLPINQAHPLVRGMAVGFAYWFIAIVALEAIATIFLDGYLPNLVGPLVFWSAVAVSVLAWLAYRKTDSP